MRLGHAVVSFVIVAAGLQCATAARAAGPAAAGAPTLSSARQPSAAGAHAAPAPASETPAIGGSSARPQGTRAAAPTPSSSAFASARAATDAALARFAQDPERARARAPVSFHDFFHTALHTSNSDFLHVEVLHAGGGAAGGASANGTLAFVRRNSPNDTWGGGSRTNDVHLFRLVDAVDPGDNPFPHAVTHNDGSTLVKVWDDFRMLKDGPPPGLTGAALRTEVTRMSVWAYVAGNVDGPVINPSNGGFARVLGPDGNVRWRGVLVDGQLAFARDAKWADGHEMVRPWESPQRVWDPDAHVWRDGTGRGLLDLGPAKQLPAEVKPALVKIAQTASLPDMARRAGLDPTREDDLAKMEGVRSLTRTRGTDPLRSRLAFG